MGSFGGLKMSKIFVVYGILWKSLEIDIIKAFPTREKVIDYISKLLDKENPYKEIYWQQTELQD